jgi:ribosomal protein S18 acetylase RimI-like enzyme
MRTVAVSDGALTLRPEAPGDRDFLRTLFAQSRPDLQLLPEAVRDHFLQMQFKTQDAAIRAEYPKARYEIVERDGAPVGRLASELGEMPFHLIDVALLPQLRNHGAGAALIRTLMDEASAVGTGVSLDVADGNPAVRLYRRLGFAPLRSHGGYTHMTWPSGA